MKLGGKIALCLAAFSCAADARAVVNDAGNPYHPIVERNVFGLKEPPPPPSTEPPKPPPANITLTGITDVLGRKLALVEWVEPTVPGQPANSKKNYSSLTEGQREGGIEVLEIDVKSGTVKVNNYGQTNTLTFKENGNKLPTTPYTPPPAIGGIPSPTANIPPPPSSQPTVSFGGATTTIGTSAGASAALKTIPQRQLRLPTAAQPQPTAPATQVPVLSKEEQEVLIEVEREVNKDNPAHPPPPPTSLNPTANLAPPEPPVAPTKPK